MLFYAGIGSRRVPKDIERQMSQISGSLQKSITLRSGGAPGSDMAFENGITNANKEIYIPWKGFNGSDSSLFVQSNEAFLIASKFHPNWANLKSSVRKLHSRNVHQV